MPHHTIQDAVKLQASAWVSKLNRGLTEEEKPQLIAWINQSPTHHQAIYRVATFFDNISELEELNGVFSVESESNFWTRKYVLLLIICTLGLSWATYLIANWIQKNQFAPTPTIYMTSVGETKDIVLPDGSTLSLNTNSKAVVEFSTSLRQVKLDYGEAEFDVSHDINRPFTVLSGSKSFTALGTTFNVEKQNEFDMELLVTEGEVLVTENIDDPVALKTLIQNETSKEDSAAIIHTNEKLKVVNTREIMTKQLSKTEISQELAWQAGMVVFDGQSLSQVLKEVSRYTNVQFEILDHHLANIRVAGTYKTGDIDGLLDTLEQNFDIKYNYQATNNIQLTR